MMEEAKEAFKKAMETDPMHPDVWLDYSAMYADEELYGEAIDIIIQGIEKQPQNSELYFRLAGYLLKKGRTKEGLQYFENALQLSYDGYLMLFEFFPELEQNIDLLNLIEIYKPLE
jgi:tetratricopeptide (TPR) repeat protein